MSLIKVPNEGARIIPNLATPDNPIIPFIEGDGIGADITPVMMKVVDAAVSKAYGGGRRIHWMEVFCGEKASRLYGEPLPQETLDTLKECVISIRGPLASPADSPFPLDAQLRQQLDLYASVRPVRWFQGVPSPIKSPDLVRMVIFRDNSEDPDTQIELDANSEAAQKLMAFLQGEMGVKKVRFPGATSIGIKQVSREGTERLVRKAIQYAIDHNHKSVTLVHKGNIMRPAESLFRTWGFELAKKEFGAIEINGGPSVQLPNGIVIKDVIADAFLQQVLLRPTEYDVIATLNLNGDYISDALAAEVGGMGITPGARLSDNLASFEATHGTAPAYAGLDKVNPSSLILAGEMMLRHIGWKEAADLIIKGIEGAIGNKIVTCDLARLMDDATEVSCSAFGERVIEQM